MRQTQRKSPLMGETSKQRKIRMQKRRQIAKLRSYAKIVAQCATSKESNQQKCTTRQERAHVQKLKNRQAAQKSRQQKKDQFKKMEQQIQLLKNQLLNAKYCLKCRRQLRPYQSQTDSNQQVIQQSPNQSTNVGSLQQQGFEMDNQQDSSYIRISNHDDSSSIWNILFIIAMIFGVFLCGYSGSNNGAPLRRGLSQLYTVNQVSSPHQAPIIEQNFRSSYSTVNDPNYLSQKNYQNGLVTLDHIKSPIPVEGQAKWRAILTSLQSKNYNQTHLRSAAKKMSQQQSVLYCIKPRLYIPRNQGKGLISSVIDIFIQGADILSLIQGESTQANGMQISGLYKLSAQITQITLIDNVNSAY